MPPLKKQHQKKLELHLEAGGSTWNLVELRLETQLETRRTEAVDEATYSRGHAKTAFGTVAET